MNSYHNAIRALSAAALLLGAGASAAALAANLPPTVDIVSPATGAAFVGPATVGLTVNATDADGSITLVQYDQGSTVIGRAPTAPYAEALGAGRK